MTLTVTSSNMAYESDRRSQISLSLCLGHRERNSFAGFANLLTELIDNQGNWDELDEGVKGWNPYFGAASTRPPFEPKIDAWVSLVRTERARVPWFTSSELLELLVPTRAVPWPA